MQRPKTLSSSIKFVKFPHIRTDRMTSLFQQVGVLLLTCCSIGALLAPEHPNRCPRSDACAALPFPALGPARPARAYMHRISVRPPLPSAGGLPRLGPDTSPCSAASVASRWPRDRRPSPSIKFGSSIFVLYIILTSIAAKTEDLESVNC
jgi:hypothetical protein